jgi:hypothetical protein
MCRVLGGTISEPASPQTVPVPSAEANEKARPKEIQSDGLKSYVPKENSADNRRYELDIPKVY